jgi:hypothetical protein
MRRPIPEQLSVQKGIEQMVLPSIGNVGQQSKNLGLADKSRPLDPGSGRTAASTVLVTHHGHDAHGSNSGKSKGVGTGLGQINAAASHIGASVRDRDRNGMTIFLVGDLNFGTKGQRFVGRRHRAIVERGTAGGFGSTLRRVTQGVHRRDTVFSSNWNVEQVRSD